MTRFKLALASAIVGVVALAAPVAGHGTTVNGPAGVACSRGAGVISLVMDNPIASGNHVWMANNVYSETRGWLGWAQTNGQYWQFSWADNQYPSYFWNYGAAQWLDYTAITVQDSVIGGTERLWIYQYFYWDDGHITTMWAPFCTI